LDYFISPSGAGNASQRTPAITTGKCSDDNVSSNIVHYQLSAAASSATDEASGCPKYK
jgi:hypothetical protein